MNAASPNVSGKKRVDATIFLSELTASSPRPSRLANGAHALPLEASAPQQSTEAPRRRFLDSPPGSPLFGANVLGERWIRWVVYISSFIRVVLLSLGLNFLQVKISSVNFCPFQSFSNIDCVLGE